jgi:sterol desaturase/sphingolipid hydroxylase (fatty acid hydroxylase superfamily)
MNLIIYAIPVFFLLIGVELLITKIKKFNHYRFNDSVTNLSLGIGSTVTGIFLKTLTVLAYIKLYDISPLHGKIPNAWWVYVLLFFGADFFYYWFHRGAHEISIMWGSHAVHHQSEEYNLTVALRQAWYQGAFSFVFYLPLAVLGFNPVMFFVVSQVITLYQFWIHTKLINKLPAPIEYIFNTPSHHRVHHGVNPQYIDKNHAGTLIIWDRMFGTFEPEQEEVVYGITKQSKSWNPVYVNFEYWKDLSGDLRKTSTWRNRASLLLKAPGWKPEELGGVGGLKPVTPDTFHKYDTEISAGLTRYVLFQFIIILAASTTFLVFQGKSPINDSLGLKVGLAGLIVFSLLNIGGIFEKKRWVLAFEYARIVILAFVIIVLLNNETLSNALGISTIVISLISLVWFSFYLDEFKLQTQSSGLSQCLPFRTP